LETKLKKSGGILKKHGMCALPTTTRLRGWNRQEELAKVDKLKNLAIFWGKQHLLSKYNTISEFFFPLKIWLIMALFFCFFLAQKSFA
jgi:hypothetical protein